MQKLLLLFGALVLSCTSVSVSQSTPSSWSNLNGLQSGQAIQVVDAAAKKYSGTFIRLSDSAIVLRDASSEESIQRADVRSVKVMKSSQRSKHTLIGAAAGAGIGAVTGAALGGCSGSCWFGSARGALAGIGAGIGVVVGAVVGAVLPAHGTTIYKATAH